MRRSPPEVGLVEGICGEDVGGKTGEVGCSGGGYEIGGLLSWS